MNLNIFNQDNKLFPLRWIIIALAGVAGTLFYYDYTGQRMFSFQSQQSWNSSGPGYHK